MKFVLVLIAFIISIIIDHQVVHAHQPISRNDSIMVVQRKKAIADFEAGTYRIAMNRFRCNAYYAEEVFYRMSGIKAEIYEFHGFCGTGMEEAFFAENCYDKIIDSLMFRTYGADIYDRISREGKFLELHEPDRYPSDEDPFGFNIGYDTDTIEADLQKHVHYPVAAKRDSIEGIVRVRIDFDSTGKVISTSIIKGIRSDLDSAAMEGARYIRSIHPYLRWGEYQSGSIALPIAFTLED